MQRAIRFFEMSGFGWLTPLLRLAAWQEPKDQLKQLASTLGWPMLAITAMLLVWQGLHLTINTSLGSLPGPVQVWQAGGQLVDEHYAEQAKEEEFNTREQNKYQETAATLADRGKLTATALASRLHRRVETMDKAQLTAFLQGYDDLQSEDAIAAVQPLLIAKTYTGPPTYVEQIITSLYTVFVGFLLATLIAIPVGILCGLSKRLNMALEPLIQVFKPISPLAWLPIVTIVVSAVYVSDDPWFEKAFLVSAIVVALCALWPTLINTAVGVAGINQDYINVGKVIRLSWGSTIRKIAIPAALPMIFTGLRISLGIGWMVLIAAEMLAQNPGLGKFVWDEFQNGSSDSMARIAFAVWTIGLIGFMLDRLMVVLHGLVAHEESKA